MSSADPNDPIPFTLAETKVILAFPLVDRFMRRPFSIDAVHYDIPYLAGYGQDGKIIYIDRDIAPWMFKQQTRPTSPFLTLHEHVEKSVIDALAAAAGRELERLMILLRMTAPDDQIYYHSHGVATCAEEYAVHMQFGQIGVDSYNAFMGTQIKRAGDERIIRVPSQLDMTPYQGSDAQDVRLRHEMEMRMAA